MLPCINCNVNKKAQDTLGIAQLSPSFDTGFEEVNVFLSEALCSSPSGDFA